MCVCCVAVIQSTAVQELSGGLAELDSDMADITQGGLADSLLEGGEEDWGLDTFSSRLAGLTGLVPSEPEPISASSQIASSLGINPHTLQVGSADITCTDSPITVLIFLGVFYVYLFIFSPGVIYRQFNICSLLN